MMPLLLVLLSVLACDGASPGTDSGTDTAAEAGPYTPTLPVSTCGLEPYDWVDDRRLGEIVEVEKLDGASLSAEVLNGLLHMAGLESFTPVRYGIETWRFRYLTQDKGELVEATGVINLPATEEDEVFDIVAWLHPTMGFNDSCAPSAGPLEAWVSSGVFASQGYAVVAPDYLGMAGWGEPSGMLHPYVVPEPTAVASLDAVRALKRFAAEGHIVDTDALVGDRVALWGASEGGFAALWADRYAAGYAPELDIVSVVAAVPPTDLSGIAVDAVTTDIDATIGLIGVLTASWVWHERPVPLETALTDTEPSYLASQVEEVLLTECRPGRFFKDAGGIEQLFQPDFVTAVKAQDWDSLGELGCMLTEGDLRRSAVERGVGAPVLVVAGEHDDLVVGERVRQDIPRLCEQGYDIEYVECAEAGHSTAAIDTLHRQLQWVADRFEGQPLQASCVVGAPEVCTSQP